MDLLLMMMILFIQKIQKHKKLMKKKCNFGKVVKKGNS